MPCDEIRLGSTAGGFGVGSISRGGGFNLMMGECIVASFISKPPPAQSARGRHGSHDVGDRIFELV